ncbi:MAG TPA: hypothetical protein VE075_11700 [Thermoanaerobaculia bacterium]|nr:hypothetical protein [Thermoanaerobaculia bacterium]
MAKTTLPPEAALARSLNRLVQRLREAAGDNLLGVALYGTPKGRAAGTGVGEVNILVVVANATLQALLPLAPVLTSAQRQSQVSSFVATPAELGIDAHLFPARLLEIRLTHRVLYGDVHLDRLEIAPRGLRFAALQELKNLEIRLRHRILDRGTDPDLLWAGIVQSLPRLIAILETVLHARGWERPANRADVLRLAGEALGIEPLRLEPINALRQLASRPTDEAVREELGAYLALLADLVRHLGRDAARDGMPPEVSAAVWE